MRYLGSAAEVKTVDRVLDDPIGIGDAFMLTQVLHPGFDQERFDDMPFLGSVVEDAPRISSVAAPLMFEPCQRFKESCPVLGVDAIFDHDQDRSAILLNGLFGDRRRPVHRWRQIHSGAGL